MRRGVLRSTACLFFALVFSVSVFASASQKAGRIDISDGELRGATCNFTMTIPEDLRGYLRVYRSILPTNTRMMEQIEFYFFPINKRTAPPLLLSINVYDKRFFKETKQWQLLFESDNYVFTVYTSPRKSALDYTADRIIYSYYADKFSDINFIRGLMTFPEEENVISKSVFIGSDVLYDKVFTTQKHKLYVPLRVCCESLGYTVLWNSTSKNINISKNGFAYVLKTDDLILRDEYYYVQPSFFMNILGANIEIDERDNVYIVK
ncbi:hypothetical protein AGMMS49975_06760 [Clostridia bacterium]|nr:hypothetical protein AGMMS49975_06760 [Clostridia bacterium]